MMNYIILDDDDLTEPKKPINNTGRLSYTSSGYSSMVRGKTSPMIHPRIAVEGKKRHRICILKDSTEEVSMKIIGINASPKGDASNTLKLVKSILVGAESEGAETKLVDLYKLNIEYCNACGTCYATGECPLIDDFEEIFEKIMTADGVVLGAPNYINSVPAPMKALFDRLSDAIHCQMLTGKFGCSACTAGGSGTDEVLKYMNGVLMTLGITVVGDIGVLTGRDPSALEKSMESARDLGKKLVKSIRGEIKYPDQDETHRQRAEYFCQLVKFNKEHFAHDYDWYVQKGLIK